MVLVSSTKSNKKNLIYANVDAAQQQFLRNLFPTAIFADMTKSTNIISNKTTSREMRLYLESKFTKLLPIHIKDVYVTFNKIPDQNEPISTYFQKQNKCIFLPENFDEPIIGPKESKPF